MNIAQLSSLRYFLRVEINNLHRKALFEKSMRTYYSQRKAIANECHKEFVNISKNIKRLVALQKSIKADMKDHYEVENLIRDGSAEGARKITEKLVKNKIEKLLTQFNKENK